MAKNILMPAIELIVIGGSAGSLDVILKQLPALRDNLPVAILLVLHRKAGSSNEDILVDLLSTKTSWKVREAEEKEMITQGTIYVAPADYHLLLESDQSFSLDVSEKVNYSRPSIDITLESAAEVYGARLLAILLSGANADGAEGMQAVKTAGGLCVVQDPASAEVGYMPQQAIDQVMVDKIVPADHLAAFINELFPEQD
ncbi:MAG: chemotaxis protein CheB [Candidatus Pseudobacter hemicellulosilyticus]|uniref:protein-glutamate methylesterase n=1 Tax=Candidatus Pseudobacter hemicellulosilyticus TaxID=3121375 RepID=A0AAJ6BGX5_9BACT|nr:MAG: chemotaxis protein CheB [Pseudobacter sp.]